MASLTKSIISTILQVIANFVIRLSIRQRSAMNAGHGPIVIEFISAGRDLIQVEKSLSLISLLSVKFAIAEWNENKDGNGEQFVTRRCWVEINFSKVVGVDFSDFSRFTRHVSRPAAVLMTTFVAEGSCSVTDCCE